MSDALAGWRALGFTEQAAQAKAALLNDARAALATMRGSGAAGSGPLDDERAFWVPGRIEFLGKHTDYAGGRSLLCAVDRGMCLVATPRDDRVVRITDARLHDVVHTTIDHAETPRPGHWSTYPLTVVRRIVRDFGDPLTGADIAFASDLPPASGMSSSSALVVATFLALADVNRLVERDVYTRAIASPEQLAGYLGAVENGYGYAAFSEDSGVGTFGGSEDHTAILSARAGALVQYSFCPIRFERAVALPDDHELVVAHSGVVAEKIGAAQASYNRLSVATRDLAAHWRAVTGRPDATLGDAIGSAPDAAQRMLAAVRTQRGDLGDRLAQFILESTELVPCAGDALARGDLSALGSLVDRSQAAAEQLLRNQIDETAWLARDARECGAAAASAFGAGFGGAVWALVQSESATDFRAAWANRYSARFPAAAGRAAFFPTRAGPPAMRL